ncbi:lipoyl(octanoyl) transferase LipB [Uliginosibacterium sp. 31-12]|uniref:lipoyl(octanoyl) transferase LipB n=1 Tax=Uliginosibacterium sp. 31-12 TaxID=3062781 RepID=UPI0026E30A46|nr:lipoyl(octanoyl) transferase LipB [Uliginosibacterium sp. 31-12]MDO6386205.1 lipoyl(octanoyl) transferase LipB [Uliginosibacterium sp. 31-12]
MEAASCVVRELGVVGYAETFEAQKRFTAERGPDTPDELWLLQHEPVYTLGLAGKPEHLLIPSEVPVVKIDRGGQITYHGPGQAVIYLLIDLARRNLKVREQVSLMEQAMLDVLGSYGIVASRREGAPGVYVREAKIGALGLKISRGCSYHGLSLNVDLDLAPFLRINPCGYEGLASTSLKEQGVTVSTDAVLAQLAARLSELLDRDYPRTA